MIKKGLKDKKVIWYGQRCWKSYTLWLVSALFWIFFGLVFPILFLLGLALFVIISLDKLTSDYWITNKGVYSNRSLHLGKGMEKQDIEDVKSVSIYKGNLGELINFGDVRIGTYGEIKVTFKGVADPDTVVKKIRGLKDNLEVR